MIVMAVEAGRQLASKPTEVNGHRFEDVHFPNALILPTNSEYVETHFYLRSRKGNSTSPEWSEFGLHVHLEKEWMDTCRGRLMIEYKKSAIEVNVVLRMNKTGNGSEIHTSLVLKAAERPSIRSSYIKILQALGLISALLFKP